MSIALNEKVNLSEMKAELEKKAEMSVIDYLKENIFKILRFDLLWRLSHLDNPDISKIGFRGTLQFIF
jgi:hypothetical protein